MALFELTAVTARAGSVPLDAREGSIQNLHHLARLAAAPDQPGHQLHGEVHMMKEFLEADAQIIQTRLAVRRLNKAVFGTFAMTGEAHVALLAVGGSESRLSRPNWICCGEATNSIMCVSWMLPKK